MTSFALIGWLLHIIGLGVWLCGLTLMREGNRLAWVPIATSFLLMGAAQPIILGRINVADIALVTGVAAFFTALNYVVGREP